MIKKTRKNNNNDIHSNDLNKNLQFFFTIYTQLVTDHSINNITNQINDNDDDSGIFSCLDLLNGFDIIEKNSNIFFV